MTDSPLPSPSPSRVVARRDAAERFPGKSPAKAAVAAAAAAAGERRKNERNKRRVERGGAVRSTLGPRGYAPRGEPRGEPRVTFKVFQLSILSGLVSLLTLCTLSSSACAPRAAAVATHGERASALSSSDRHLDAAHCSIGRDVGLGPARGAGGPRTCARDVVKLLNEDPAGSAGSAAATPPPSRPDARDDGVRSNAIKVIIITGGVGARSAAAP